jgi:hypothetical protein
MDRRLKTPIVLLGLAAVLSSPALAAPSIPGFALRAKTSRFEFYTRGDARLNVERPEAQLARVESLLGHKVSGTVEYYHYDRPEDIAAATGRYAGGLTFPDLGQIHTTASADNHELVHLVAYELGDPGPFFQEGLAVVLGDRGRWMGQPVDRVAKKVAKGTTLASMIAGFDRIEPREGYAVAGSFVAYLVERHGLDKVVHFFRACHGGRDTATAFAAIFGQSLEAAGGSWAQAL